MTTIWKRRNDGILQRFNISPLRPEIVKLYGEGLPSRIVAKKIGISHSRVLQLLKKENIKRRPIEKPIMNSNYKILTPDRAYIFGVMCGDGCLFTTLVNKKKWIYRQYAVNLAVRDLDFAQEFARCLQTVYGIAVNIRFRKSKKIAWSDIWIASTKRKAIFMDLNQYKFGTRTWEIPKDIIESEDVNVIASFLRGFFDSEGSISIGKRGAMISVSSTNKNGLECIRELILRLGIGVSELKYDKRIEGRNMCFYLYITHSDNYNLYLDKIGFSIKRKEDKLKQYLRGLKHEKSRTWKNISSPPRSDMQLAS